MYRREGEPTTSTSSSSTGNAGRSGASSPWSVRAEFTIRRGTDSSTSPVETTSRSATIVPITEATGVRMTYSFTPTQTHGSPVQHTMAPPGTGYGFQRGNLVFTSTPPRSLIPVRSHTIPRTAYSVQHQHQLYPRLNVTSVPDSGYASEQAQSGLPSRQPSDKRCRSTYSIVLSSANQPSNIPVPYQQQQQPQSHLPYPRPWTSYYQTLQQQKQPRTGPCCKFSAVPEVCEDCAEAAAGGGSPFVTHFCTKLAERTATTTGKVASVSTTTTTSMVSKDAASQTTDIEAQQSPVAARRKVRRKATGVLAGSSGRDELKNNNFGQLSRTPASMKSPTPPTDQQHAVSDSSTSTTNTRDDSSEKRKRTVHIDVYCTGTDDDPNDEEEEDDDVEDDDSSSSSSSGDRKAASDKVKRAIVCDSKDVCITHTQAKSGILPRGFQDEKAFLKRASERNCESFKHAPMRMPSLASSKGYESDDLLSSLYPSRFSSYSRLRDFDSSVPWSAASSSVGIADDAASATSWKDTVSDIESLRNSSKASITPCDSFEYADSVDRERIKRMEAMMSKKGGDSKANFRGKNWRSPQIERKHLLQGKMMKDYMDKHPPVGWSSESSVAASGSDEESAEEVGWSFISSSENTSVIKGKLTLPTLGNSSHMEKTDSSQVMSASTDQEISQAELIREVRTTIFRDRIGPFGSASPSPPPSKLQSRMTSPFTTPQGERTDHIVKASIFGRVVNTFRKPGHHVGPAKNPACLCEHCRRHFEELSARGRTRSLDRRNGSVERRNGSREPSTPK